MRSPSAVRPAAAITVFFATPAIDPAPSIPAPAQTADRRLVAQAQSEDGAISLATLVEEGAGRVSLSVSGLEPGPGRAPELWVVHSDGAPRSLRQIPEGGSFSRDLTRDERALFVPGASLAITYEDGPSISHEAPSSDILVLGSLSEI